MNLCVKIHHQHSRVLFSGRCQKENRSGEFYSHLVQRANRQKHHQARGNLCHLCGPARYKSASDELFRNCYTRK